MKIVTKKVENVIIVYPPSWLDLDTSAAFKTRIAKLIDAESECHLLLNFKDVKHINSSNLSELIKAKKKMDKSKRAMKMCGVHTKVKDVFAVVNFDSFFEIFDTEDEALFSFKN